MQTSQTPAELPHVGDLNQHLIVIRQHTPSGAGGAELLEGVEQFLFKPLQPCGRAQDGLVLKASGTEKSIAAWRFWMWRTVPGEPTPLSLSNNGLLLCRRESAVIVHRNRPQGMHLWEVYPSFGGLQGLGS